MSTQPLDHAGDQGFGIFSAIPNHLRGSMSTPHGPRPRRRQRKPKGAQPPRPSPLRNATPTVNSTPSGSPETQPKLLPAFVPNIPDGRARERGRDMGLPQMQNQVWSPVAERAILETLAVARNNARMLEEVQMSLDHGMEEVHASVGGAMERLETVMEEMLATQQQMMDLTMRMMERVMRIDRNIPVMN